MKIVARIRKVETKGFFVNQPEADGFYQYGETIYPSFLCARRAMQTDHPRRKDADSKGRVLYQRQGAST